MRSRPLLVRGLRVACALAVAGVALFLGACESRVFHTVHHQPVPVFQDSMGIAPGGPCNCR